MPSHAAYEKSGFYQRQRMSAVPMDRHSTANRMSRVTRGGRKLTYVLTVIQQPERARACGSGAKSSSDRRPVDPPPVVELKIYHEDGPKSEHITFAYDANFFLFVTLEPAPPTSATCRSQPAATTSNPVLTGMPVSGMAYLDRPSEAGYFIFPDLSVRHEGQYVLSFNLYEETKNHADQDLDPTAPLYAPATAADPDSSFDWRLEVKSAPFTVYSAKKFPGLTESTHLSRIVAEQGCRVRIRRDVRMRRRDHKPDDQTPHEEYLPCRDEKEIFRHRTRSRSLSGSIPDSAQTPTRPDPFTVAPSQPQPPPPRPSYLDRSLAPLQTTSTHTSAFHPSPAPSYTHQDRSSYSLSSRSLRQPRDSRDYTPDFRPSSALAHSSPPSPPTLLPPPANTSLYSSLNSHGITNLPSLERRLLNPTSSSNHLAPPALCHPPMASINLSPLDTSLYASNSMRKRPHDRNLPGPLPSNHLRLFHGQRPPTPDAHVMEPDNDAMGLEKPMTYKRASGAMRVRGPPIIS